MRVPAEKEVKAAAGRLRGGTLYALLGSLAVVAAAAVAAGTAQVEVTGNSFKCLRSMTPVRGFYVDNIAGDLDGTLRVARSETGGVYPPGSVVQLFPNEVMVKREAGFSPPTKDWEFFELDVSKSGSVIRKRGFADVKNRFGGNCFACHVQARPEWDMICEEGHGCDKLPIAHVAITALQNTDPRCEAIPVPWTQRFMAWMIKTFTSL